MAVRPAQRLQQRALAWLAQREHSRRELRRKLLRAARPAEGRHEDGGGADAAPALVEVQVDAVLDRLEQQGLLSDERFVASRVRVRSPTQGARRIEAELAQHGLKLPDEERRRLHDGDLDRALALWQRRFGAVATTPVERARQMRYLAGRGFDADVIRRVMRAAERGPAD